MNRTQNRLGDLGSLYHVFSRGLQRKQLFLDDRDRHTFLLILGDVLRETRTRCYAFALMGTHYHLVLQTVETQLSEVMHRVNLRFAIAFNRRHDGVGHVFQGRFQSVLIEDDDHLLTALAYVHLNPVRAGIVADERALRDYRWTSYATLMGPAAAPFVEVERVLAAFGHDVADARRALTVSTQHEHSTGAPSCGDEVEGLLRAAAIAVGLTPAQAGRLRARNVRGAIGALDRIEAAQRRRDHVHWCRDRLLHEGWTPERLLVRVCQLLRVSVRHVRTGGRTRPQSRARALFAHLSSRYLGTNCHDIGRLVGVGHRSASRSAIAGERLLESEGIRPSDVFAAAWMRHKQLRWVPGDS